MSNLKKASVFVLVAVLAVVGYKFAAKSGGAETAAAAGATAPADTSKVPPAPTAVTTSPADTRTVPPAPTTVTSPAAPSRAAKQISASETYRDPSGEEKVTFMLTVDSTGTITEAASTVLAENPIAVRRQTAFQSGFAAAVVGKKLSSLSNIDVVSGSSLTTGAFNKALTSLKAQM